MASVELQTKLADYTIRRAFEVVGRYAIALPRKDIWYNEHSFDRHAAAKFKKMQGIQQVGGTMLGSVNGMFTAACKKKEAGKLLKSMNVLSYANLLNWHVDEMGDPAFFAVSVDTFNKMQEICKGVDE